MTDYLSIADTEVAVKSPYTASLAKRWRDNPVAIAEGAAGAPKVAGVALDTVLGDMAFDTVGAGITGISARLSLVNLHYGFSWTSGSAGTTGYLQARFQVAGVYGSWVTVTETVSAAAFQNGVVPGAFAIRPRTGLWRDLFSGRAGNAGGELTGIVLRAVISAGTYNGGRLLALGLHGVA